MATVVDPLNSNLNPCGDAFPLGTLLAVSMEKHMNTRKSPKFIRTDNYLTRYGHACGYLDSATLNDDRMAITMGVDGACYHVKARPYNGHDRVWECFELDERDKAVKLFRGLMRTRGAKRNPNYTYS